MEEPPSAGVHLRASGSHSFLLAGQSGHPPPRAVRLRPRPPARLSLVRERENGFLRRKVRKGNDGRLAASQPAEQPAAAAFGWRCYSTFPKKNESNSRKRTSAVMSVNARSSW